MADKQTTLHIHFVNGEDLQVRVASWHYRMEQPDSPNSLIAHLKPQNDQETTLEFPLDHVLYMKVIIWG